MTVTALAVPDDDDAPLFYSIKHFYTDGREFWLAREIASAIGYAEWRNFERCVIAARDAIQELSGEVSAGQHVSVTSTARAGAVPGQELRDYRMTRYGAYMALGFSAKPELKHYFATKTREAEVRSAFDPASLSRRDILRMALEAEETAQQAVAERDQALAVVAVSEPKIAAYDAFMDDDQLMGFRELARLIKNEGFGYSEDEFKELLKEWGILDKTTSGIVANVAHVNAHRMRNLTGEFPRNSGRYKITGKFTKRGVDYVLHKLHGNGDARRAIGN